VTDPEPAPEVKPGRRWNWRWAARVAGGAALLALLTIAALHFAERPTPRTIVRMVIDAPPDTELQDFAVSPDGRALAFTATAPEGGSLLWIRSLDLLEPRELRGSEGASMPFWSPDSRWIGFFAGGKLKAVRIDSSSPMTLANAPQPHGGSWGQNSVILFAAGDGGLQRVTASGGEAVRITSSESAKTPLSHRWPQFLPDGVHFLFSAPDRESASGIHVGSLDTGEIRHLIRGSSGGIYADGRILFVKDGALFSQTLDTGRLEVSGESHAVPFAESIGVRANRALPFSAGAGMLAYRAGGVSDRQMLLWIDRSGKIVDRAAEPAEQEDFALSPDVTTVAVSRRASGEGSDLWLLDLVRGAATRMTFDARGIGSPLWAPDGRRLAYISHAPEAAIRTIALNASREPETLAKLPEDSVLESWSADGRSLLFTGTAGTKLAAWALPFEGDRKPAPFLKGEFNYKQPQFAPDGRWVAYVSDESGRDEGYVSEFPSPKSRVLVSVKGGIQPRWGRDGRELFYVSPDRRLMAVPVEFAGVLRVGLPQMLLPMPAGAERFVVAGDGRRFLIAVPSEEQQRSPVNVVLNWTIEK